MWEALTLGAGYNAALVTIGAALFGAAAGPTGTFLFLRKRALVSDALAHATLPGIALAFLAMVLSGGDGRFLPGLLAGAAVSAMVGLVTLNWLARATRLSEDAAIGAVLSVFFGFGVVLLTVIQSVPAGRQAGLEGFLLGSTAGMLMSDAVVIAAGGSLAVVAVLILRRAFLLIAFDEGHARATGLSVERYDLALMALVLAVTVIGLKFVGLILVVALLIIPPAAARFWTDRAHLLAPSSAAIGAFAGWVGSAASASAPGLPTGPLVVLTASAIFTFSLLFAPRRGVLGAYGARRRFETQVHLRQGLLAMARGEKVLEPLTQRILARRGYMRADGVATETGRAEAARALHDERRWQEARQVYRGEQIGRYDGLTSLGDVLTEDELAEIDRRIGPPRAV